MLDTGFPGADVENDFLRARRNQALASLAHHMRRHPPDDDRLLRLDEVVGRLGMRGQLRRGLQTIRLDTIAGTAGSRRDFDRHFRPTSNRVRPRWEQLALAERRGAAIPPIEVYLVGGLHFVSDGHHRVSIAAATGQQAIDAYVTEVLTSVPGPSRACGSGAGGQVAVTSRGSVAGGGKTRPARRTAVAAQPGSARVGFSAPPYQTTTRDVITARKENQMVATGSSGEDVRVAVLGTGIMGSAMARNLVSAGLRTMVWDRSPGATTPLSEAGALVAASPGEAVRDAQVVITMLPTVDVVNSVVFAGGVAEALAEGAVWAQMGTIGLTETAEIASRLGQLRPDVVFVDAPVSGSKGPAEAGRLLILASGPQAAAAIVDPVFSVIGRKTVWLGEAGQGSRMKLAVNAYMSILIEGVAEALELAGRLGIDDAKLAECIEGGPLDAPIADAKLHKMEHGDFAPEFPLAWALKDVDLAVGAAGDGELPLLAALSRQWRAAVDAGYGREDVSAARLALSGGS